VCLNREPVTLTNCTFVDNAAPVGSAIAVRYANPCAIDNCILVWNEDGEAVSCLEGASANLNCCDVWDNEAGDWVGCLNGQQGQDGNVCEDPLFCGPEWNPLLPYLLHGDSPCAPDYNPECGLIGAWPVGCGALQEGDGLPSASDNAEFQLSTPNPATGATLIRFAVPAAVGADQVRLNVYHPTGRLVRTLVDARRRIGEQSVFWDASDRFGSAVPAGIYFLRLKAGEESITKQLTVIR